ncbi:hypothetical protein PVAND_015860 [Polypedilum vanderplanki]|uniref:Uncharacterized protein n=1 Tax=Polypedilum vanderplanki TaxID=319348 RepID=A0A9J6BED7_POLVA|nr:hypothetical protein PVAND_015860 [Polypedilum vanderplanki]
MKAIFILILPMVLSDVTINCEFKKNTWWSKIGELYQCELISNPSITLPRTVISSATGSHLSSMNHNDVKEFFSNSKTIHYIPHGLSKIFPNLIALHIENGRIKEIHQEDLKEYPNIKVLNFKDSDITYIEQDLFKFNTQLMLIRFWNNYVKQVYPTVFDHLNYLERLDFEGNNQCVTVERITRSDVLEMIKDIKQNCKPDFYLSFENLSKTLSDQNTIIQALKNDLTQKSSEISLLKAKFTESSAFYSKQNENLTKIIHNLMTKSQLTQNNMNQMFASQDLKMTKILNDLRNEVTHKGNSIEELKANITQEQSSVLQKFFNFITEKEPILFFIAVPSLCLLTIFNVIMIYFCCRNRNSN